MQSQNQYRIGAPCSMDWNQMKSVKDGRFCDHCSKKVHNLSNKTQAEIGALYLANGNSLCGKMVEKRKVLTVTQRTLPTRLKHFLIALLAAMGVISISPQSSFAQSITTSYKPFPEIIIKGDLLDELTAEPLSWATILLTNADHSSVTGTTADEDGKFELNNLSPGEYTLNVRYPNYSSNEFKITLKENKSVYLSIRAINDYDRFSIGIILEPHPSISIDPFEPTTYDQKTINEKGR